MHDKLSNGLPYKMLTILDEYTREARCVVDTAKMGAADVFEPVYPLLLRRGKAGCDLVRLFEPASWTHRLATCLRPTQSAEALECSLLALCVDRLQ